MVKSKDLLFSIITPTLNRGKFLEDCILSIRNQGYPFIEHIVIDGGSTDNSLDILKNHENAYNLKWISEKDEGCADAMNKGFKMASGDIVCWLDSDDTYLPGTINKIVDIFRKRPDIDVIFGDILIANQNGETIDFIRNTRFSAEDLIYIGLVLNPQAIFWRKGIQNKIGAFDKTFLRVADADFFIRMSLSVAKFYHTRDFLSVYRLHPQQLTKSLELCRAEEDVLAKKYKKKNLAYWPESLKILKILLRRSFYFIKQGDIWWVIRGALRHINILHAHE
jgi:glycosyltransferase involved in cell wall biosynthesis